MTFCEHCNDCPIHELVNAFRQRIQNLEAELEEYRHNAPIQALRDIQRAAKVVARTSD